MKRSYANAGLFLAAMVFAAVAAGGCTRARTGVARYFPLKPGMAWTFRFTGSTGATGELTTANLGTAPNLRLHGGPAAERRRR